MTKSVRIYVSAIIVLSLLGFAVLYHKQQHIPFIEIKAGICFGLLAVLAEVLRYSLESTISESIVFIPVTTVICLSPSWVAVTVAAAAILGGGMFTRQIPIKLAFNVAQYALSAAAGVAIYRCLGGGSLLHGDVNWAAYVAMFATFMLTNGVLVSSVIALSKNQSFAEAWRSIIGHVLVYDALALPFPVLFSVVYNHFGVMGVVGLSIPLLGTRQLYMINRQLEKTNQELLQLMVAAMEARDPYTSGHSTRVSYNVKVIARALSLSATEVEQVGIAGLLHDVGKIHEVFAPILRKPGKLTADERLVMETHPIKSAELVQNVSRLQNLVTPIRHHHENWDGTGYPDGLAGEAIPLYSRIIMFADTIDAMTTDRPYRAALGEEEVKGEFVRLRGRQFDPRICDVILTSPLYPLLFEKTARDEQWRSGGRVRRQSNTVQLVADS